MFGNRLHACRWYGMYRKHTRKLERWANRLVRTMYRKVGIPLEHAVEMMTKTPARMLNVLNHKGVIEIGKDADLILFDDDVRIKLVMVG